MTQFRLMHYIFAAVAFLVSFAVYVKTIAPTVPFWDGGEFIATSYILGIPHPPGSPLYILIGRLFSLLPFGEVAWRVNLSSCFFSSLTVLFVYFNAVKAVTMWRGKPDSVVNALMLYSGGLVGALLLAFSDTFWFNAVEAEVYASSMFIMMLSTWLLLIWIERHQEAGSERYLMAIAYIIFLGIAIHMFTLLVAPAVFLCAILTDRKEIGTPKVAALFAVMGIIMGSVVASIDPFFVAVPLTIAGLLLFKGDVPWTWFLLPMGLALVISFLGVEGAGGFNSNTMALGDFEITYGTLMFTVILSSLALILVSATAHEPTRYRWNFWATLLVLVAIGYSVHFYVPLRSSQQPAINENDPSNWKNFESFLERKQYGQESMLVSMFNRKGSLSEQFGDGENIGFWGFFKRQYSTPEFPMWLFPVLLGILGLMAQWRYEKRSALYFTTMFLICSLGLILYMNFSDGSRGIQREVRERDYFFTPAFVFFGILMGIGVVQLLDHLKQWVQEIRLPSVPIIACCSILALAIPIVPFNVNYPTHTREGNYVPYDYGYNILMSCDENAILFTNGDNDTFTLWFLQEVEGLRKDVRVVNLSLLNTNWYIKQLKNMEPKVPIALSDEVIDRMGLQLWEEQQVDIAGLSWNVPRAGALPDGRGYIRVQDLMILHIMQTNNWERPMFFAVTVSPDNYVGLRDYFQMEGMAFRITQQQGRDRLDPDRTHHNLWNVYKYRGIADSTVYKDPQTSNLLRNYSAAFQQLALLRYREGQIDQAIQEMEKYRTLKITDSPLEKSLLLQFYAEASSYDKAENLALDMANANGTFDGYIILSDTHRRQGRIDEAVAILERGLADMPQFTKGYEQLAKVYFAQGDTSKVIQTLERWQEIAPEDTVVQETLNDLQPTSAE